jgi:hypothetical protein
MAKAKAKSKKRPAASAGRQNTTAPAPKRSPIELQVQELLAENAAGNIDNVFDIMEELADYEERLPRTSPLRPEWDEFYADCMSTAVSVSE